MNDNAGRGRKGPAGLALTAGLVLGAIVFLAIAVSSISHTPGIGGWLGGILGGAFAGLLVAGAGAWAAMALIPKPAAPTPPPGREPVIGGTLEHTLAELEAIRLRTRQQIGARQRLFIPLCAIAGLILGLISLMSGSADGVFDLLKFTAAGAGVGWFWATHKLSEAYRRLYKERVLPQLASQFGALTYRQAAPDLDTLRRHRLFDEFDGWTCEDEIVGDYRGLGLSIVELKLTHGSGKERRTVFNGLLTTVTLPRNLKGTTVVLPDRGVFGNLRDRLAGGGVERVVIEDPIFEKAYEVYGADQISARALLTPAFMERFRKLAESGRFGAPIALAQDARLLLAQPKGSVGDLFEPPSYRQPAAGRDALTALSADIEHVLAVADAVIDLDYAARAQAAPAP